MEWPERREIVTGGTIAAGDDPDAEPLQSGVTITGGDPGEGLPFDVPDREPDEARPGGQLRGFLNRRRVRLKRGTRLRM